MSADYYNVTMRVLIRHGFSGEVAVDIVFPRVWSEHDDPGEAMASAVRCLPDHFRVDRMSATKETPR